MGATVIALVGSITATLLVSWALAIADLRLGSGIGSAAAVLLVTTLHAGAPKPWARAAISALLAGATAAYLAHLTQQIVGPAWPEALRYVKSPLIAPLWTFVAALLALADARAFTSASRASAP